MRIIQVLYIIYELIEELRYFFSYVKQLEFEEEPNYNFLIELFEKMLQKYCDISTYYSSLDWKLSSLKKDNKINSRKTLKSNSKNKSIIVYNNCQISTSSNLPEQRDHFINKLETYISYDTNSKNKMVFDNKLTKIRKVSEVSLTKEIGNNNIITNNNTNLNCNNITNNNTNSNTIQKDPKTLESKHYQIEQEQTKNPKSKNLDTNPISIKQHKIDEKPEKEEKKEKEKSQKVKKEKKHEVPCGCIAF